MFFNVHMGIFCLVFYMTNFLNCIQSGDRTSRAAQNASKHIFPRIQDYIYQHIVAVMSLLLVFIQHSLQCFQKHLHMYSNVKVNVILTETMWVFK